MEDVSGDEDAPAFGVGEDFFDGEAVKKGLRGVGVGAVSGVDDAGFGVAGDDGGEAAVVVPDDDVVDFHGLKGVDGVMDGFPFDDG